MKLRQFNGAGHAEYKKFIDGYLKDTSITVPAIEDLLENDALTEIFDPGCDVENTGFDSRYEFGVYLLDLLKNYPKANISENSKLWDWLALFFFEEIRGTKDYSKFVLSTENFRNWYRHLIRSNWQLVDAHEDACEWMLGHYKLNKHGDLLEQPISRESIATNTELLKVAKRLYVDNGVVKPRVMGRGNVDGDINRFVIWVQQVEKTYDLDSMNVEQILSLIPSDDEFDDWLATSA
jgi:hypothetical protein